MAYVVVSFKGKEVGRWPLSRTLTIGRSGECDVIVRDILLSRRHCQVELSGNHWVVVDLGSKNGTRRGKQRVSRHRLADGDILTLGKTTVKFVVGRLPTEYTPPVKRPTDPFEALSGTVSDFDPAAAEAFCRENGLPKPRPIPKEPAAYAKDDLYSLLTEIASSSWDSIYAQASQPKRPTPRVEVRHSTGGAATLPRTRSRLAFAEELQVRETRPIRPASPLELPRIASPSTIAPRPGRFRSTLSTVARALVELHHWMAPAGRIRIF